MRGIAARLVRLLRRAEPWIAIAVVFAAAWGGAHTQPPDPPVEEPQVVPADVAAADSAWATVLARADAQAATGDESAARATIERERERARRDAIAAGAVVADLALDAARRNLVWTQAVEDATAAFTMDFAAAAWEPPERPWMPASWRNASHAAWGDALPERPVDAPRIDLTPRVLRCAGCLGLRERHVAWVLRAKGVAPGDVLVDVNLAYEAQGGMWGLHPRDVLDGVTVAALADQLADIGAGQASGATATRPRMAWRQLAELLAVSPGPDGRHVLDYWAAMRGSGLRAVARDRVGATSAVSDATLLARAPTGREAFLQLARRHADNPDVPERLLAHWRPGDEVAWRNFLWRSARANWSAAGMTTLAGVIGVVASTRLVFRPGRGPLARLPVLFVLGYAAPVAWALTQRSGADFWSPDADATAPAPWLPSALEPPHVWPASMTAPLDGSVWRLDALVVGLALVWVLARLVHAAARCAETDSRLAASPRRDRS